MNVKHAQMTLVAMMFSLFSMATMAGQITTEVIEYTLDGQSFTGLLAYDASDKEKRPGVLVVHEWWGANEYAQKRAKDLAKEGFVAFALDMYGTGKIADHPNEAKAFMTATLEKMDVAEKRFQKGREILASRSNVDASKIGAIGYCFGGGIVLHMARTGEDLKGVASFHGSLGTKTPAEKGKVKAQIKVYNGAKDPFVTAEQIEGFKKEMDAAGANYEFVNYENAVHSFTNPGADAVGKKFEMPLAYDAQADAESWKSMVSFFNELFK